MRKISDNDLVSEISRRLDEYNKALHDLKKLTRKLETVNRKLQESEATKSDFLSNIRNEINNPLASIMGLSKHIIGGALKQDEIVSVAQTIYYETFDLDFQLNNIFIAAEIEAGESSIGVANVEVESFINRIIDSFEHKIKDRNLNVEFNCKCENGFTFKTDPLKLHAIIMNLMANAVKFCLNGKSIKINVAKGDENLVISIEDQGKGIADEEKESMFDRFKQLEAGARKEHRGHGLGLSIVKSLLNQLGGQVDISGVYGENCIFTFSVPDFMADSETDVFSEEGNEFIFGSEEEF